MKIRIERTERGFKSGDFTDYYDQECSIQESSLATKPAIWLGLNTGAHYDACTMRIDSPMPHSIVSSCLARMHLTRKHVKALIPILQHFVDTGALP